MKTLATQHRLRSVATAVVTLLAVASFASCARPTANAATNRVATHDVAHAAAGTTTAVASNATAMICGEDAQHDLRATLGVDTTAPVRATWRNGRYACDYAYAHDATLALAVQQLADPAAAARFYDATTARLGRRTMLTGLGQHAATTKGGFVVVQKDNDVLIVNPGGLPPRFGNPPDSPADVALSVAATIMGCWNG
jgi:hypothetical protein